MIGVSPDPVARVKRFHDKQSLNFRLLADGDHSVSETYGVWVEKSMYGEDLLGHPAGEVHHRPGRHGRHVIPKVSPKTHDEAVLAALRR